MGEWYVCWPSNRVLRDQLEPLLLFNSGCASVQLFRKQLHVQLVDRFQTAVFQRTFWASVDYHLVPTDPFQSVAPLGPLPAPDVSASDERPLVEGAWDIGTAYDILSCATPDSAPKKDSAHSAPKKESAPKEDPTPEKESTPKKDSTAKPAEKASNKKDSKKGQLEDGDGDDEEEDEGEGGPLSDEEKVPRGKRASARGPVREDKAVWRFSALSSPALHIKVQFSELATDPEKSGKPDNVANVAKVATAWEPVPGLASGNGLVGTGMVVWESWLSPAQGAKVSQRCTPDLQDDLMNLTAYSETCEIAVTNGDVQFSGTTKRAKKGHIYRYVQPFEFDATPLTSASAPQSKPRAKGRATSKTGPKTGSGSAALPRRPVHNTPRFYVEYVHKETLPPTLRANFLLRALRILHKLVGSSSRIEWILHHNKPTAPPVQSEPVHNPSGSGHTSSLSGPLVCSFYQGTLAAERLVGALLCLRTFKPRRH
jgi:hypothetical protein